MSSPVEEGVGPRRRVSARKRQKPQTYSPEPETRGARRSSRSSSSASSTANDDPARWIENSFGSRQLSSKNSRSGSTGKGRGGSAGKGRGGTRGKRGGGSTSRRLMPETTGDDGDCEILTGITPSSISSGGHAKFLSYTQGQPTQASQSQALLPSTLDPANRDAYCSQHDSFDESDLDLTTIDLLEASAQSPVFQSKRKATDTPLSAAKNRGKRKASVTSVNRDPDINDSVADRINMTGTILDQSMISQMSSTQLRGEFTSEDRLFSTCASGGRAYVENSQVSTQGSSATQPSQAGNSQASLYDDPAQAAVSFHFNNSTGKFDVDQSGSQGNLGSKSNKSPLAALPPNANTLNHGISVPANNNLSVNPFSPQQSFRDRLKSRLLENANSPATRGPQFQQKLRQEMVEAAMKEAEEIQERLGSQVIGDVEGPFYGLSNNIKKLFEKHRGISKLYDWQDQCLSLPSVQARQNLIYSLPTSGGKTLVAEILILKELLINKRDAMLILPFVSIVHEKVRGLSAFAVDLDFLVEEYAAHKGSIPPRIRRKKKSIYICTIEKANSLLNSLIESKRINNIGLVVVDELHMLGEGGSRGAILEMTLTKIMHAASSTQIIGMSATLSNISDLQRFLAADVYCNDFRPVKLREFVKLSDTVFEINGTALCPQDRLRFDHTCSFRYDAAQKQLDPDCIAALVLEVIPDHSCLVFCRSKKNCENVAELVCKIMPSSMLEVKTEERRSLLQALLFDGNGQICPVLRNTVLYGVAYHHSGLTMDERKLIEEAYSEGTLCMLACTSTLAAGVNLPAKRVILRSPHVGINFVSRSQYKQMVGRAGRAGIDSSGESIVIVQNSDKAKLMKIVEGGFEYCGSSLMYNNKKGIRTLLLTTIGLKITETLASIAQFLEKTLCYVQSVCDPYQDLKAMAREALQNLHDLRLITINGTLSGEAPKDGSNFIVKTTALGHAVYKGPIDVDLGPRLYEDLVQAQQSFVLVNHLHLLYVVTPYDLAEDIRPDWSVYLDEYTALNESEQQVATLVGVSEWYIVRKMSGQSVRKASVSEVVVKRFYITLILYSLWKQHGIWEVAQRFSQPRGYIQQLLNQASSFAFCVMKFCDELEEFWAYQELLSAFVKRLSYCISDELLPLMEIPGVKIGRARQLYTAGFRTVQLVAFTEPEQLVASIQHMPRKTAKQIVSSAQMLLQEKTEMLMEEAKELIDVPDLTLDDGKEDMTAKIRAKMLSEADYNLSQEEAGS